MISYGMTDIGKKRKINQDYLFYSDDPVGYFPNLYIVADGMGGHRAGDKASSYAVTRFVQLAGKEEERLHPFLAMEKLMKQVNKEVFDLSVSNEEYTGMGTTFVAATVVDHVLYVMNIGDSRLYFYDGHLQQVTLDHSLVEELVRAGELNRQESRNHPQKNIITKAIGVGEEMEPDFFMLDMKEKDRFLLCSDGLSNMVDDETLEQMLSQDDDLEAIANRCVEEALFFGGLDNIAIVLAEYESRG